MLQATGNLGPAVLNALLSADFQVTVLTRQSSSPNLPASVTVKPVNYSSLDSLKTALQGQDAVVSTIASASIDDQKLLVEAAVQAGVKRFIPSEFGANTMNEKARALPVFHPKIAVQDKLKEVASSGGMTYTIIPTGPFLDWGIAGGLIFSPKEKSIDIYDDGEQLFSANTLPTVGKAVASVLKNPDATKNRAVFFQDTVLSNNKLLAMGKKATVSDDWKTQHIKVDDLLAGAYAELKKEQPDPKGWVYPMLFTSVYGKGYGAHWEKNDNELLGIKEMSDDEVQALVNKYA